MVNISFLHTTVAVALYLLLLFVAQRVLESARRELTPEQKAKVMDVSASLRTASFLPPVVLVLLYGGAVNLWPEHFRAVTAVIYTLLIGTAVLFSVAAYRKIRLLDVPGFYLRRLLASQILYIAAHVFLCGFLSVYYAT